MEEQQAEDQGRYKELYVWQILDGDESIGFRNGLMPLCEQFMTLK